MKFVIVALALIACTYADVSELGYNYQPTGPAPAPIIPQVSYIPPASKPVNSYVPPPPPQPQYQPAPAPINSYVPPQPIGQPISAYVPPAPIAPLEEIEQHPADGYRYKTNRRVVYRRRT